MVAGYDDGGSADFALARYLSNGNLDTSFNNLASPTSYNGDGKVSFTFGAGTFGGVERATSVALQADGKIVVAGYTDAGTAGGIDTFDFAVARLNADGTLDNTFSGNGKFTYNFGNDDRAAAVAVQPDGKIVVVGSWDGGAADMVAIRLNANGTLDTTFNNVAAPTAYNGDGKLDIFFGAAITSTAEFATSVALKPDGKIVVGGYTNFGGPQASQRLRRRRHKRQRHDRHHLQR